MTLIDKELEVVKISDLKNIKIPNYQRPYTWGIASVNTLFDDTYKAYKKQLNEYRLGSVILHKVDNSYFIVDGQQRLTTIALLLFCLNKKCKKSENFCLMDSEYSFLSKNTILTNHVILQQRVSDLDSDECKNYRNYILSHCTFVKIVTDDEQEAFQFFDSQNSRGKELAPHDLLKSYHLREMNDVETDRKVSIINKWENINQDDLEVLFENYLYPVTQWFRCKNGLYYSSKKIRQFKGITKNNNYNYAVYHKSSNLFVEQFNQSGNHELLNTTKLNQFQLTQPIIAGSRFFEYSIHYKNLLEAIRHKIEIHHLNKDEIPSTRAGDIYIRQLYECVLLFFADKFGIESINDTVFRIIYTWSYLLRLKMSAVYQQTINKYACGEHKDRTNIDIPIFAHINDCVNPEDLNMLIIPKPDKGEITNENKNKYNVIYKKLFEDNGWQEDDE